MRFVRASSCLSALSLFALAGCGGGDSAQGGADEMDSMGMEEVSVAFQEVDQSAAEGSVTISMADGSYTVVVAMDTHRGPGDYPVHIYGGTCATGGSIVVSLNSVEGQEGGEGRETTTFPAADLPAGQPYFIQLHDAQDGSALACADLPELGS